MNNHCIETDQTKFKWYEGSVYVIFWMLTLKNLKKTLHYLLLFITQINFQTVMNSTPFLYPFSCFFPLLHFFPISSASFQFPSHFFPIFHFICFFSVHFPFGLFFVWFWWRWFHHLPLLMLKLFGWKKYILR